MTEDMYQRCLWKTLMLKLIKKIIFNIYGNILWILIFTFFSKLSYNNIIWIRLEIMVLK